VFEIFYFRLFYFRLALRLVQVFSSNSDPYVNNPFLSSLLIKVSHSSISTVEYQVMYNTARIVKPKLSLSISAAQNATRPSLSLKSPSGLPRTPISPISAASPTTMRFSTLQVPNYAYTNSCASKSILKKQPSSRAGAVDKRIQFQVTPTIHCVTPIENPDEYYGKHMKMSREERRWTVRQ
jgi:hypothetical protein